MGYLPTPRLHPWSFWNACSSFLCKAKDETAEANCDEAHQEEFRKGRPRAKEFGSYVLEAPAAGKVLGLVATSGFKRCKVEDAADEYLEELARKSFTRQA